jgi:hypothetical protein
MTLLLHDFSFTLFLASTIFPYFSFALPKRGNANRLSNRDP